MRPEILNPLFTEITALKGVGTALAKPLMRLRMERLKDLAYHLPERWVHRVRASVLDDVPIGSQCIITLTATDYRSGSSPRAPLRIHAVDSIGNHISIVYFRAAAKFARGLHPLGEARVVAGKLEQYGEEWQMVHPDHVLKPGEEAGLREAEPVYALSDGITNHRMGGLIDAALERAPDLPEWIERGLLEQRGWAGWRACLHIAHHGGGAADVDGPVRDRLAYDELLANQVAMQFVRVANEKRRALPIVGTGRLTDALRLPFEPTGAQKRALAEIDGDLAQARPMLRLLQGDVGSGKTLVALIAMLRAVEAGQQAAMLAPTEILARQHFESLREMMGGLPVNIAVLTGRDKGRAREATLMGLADGSIHILVGTHAIFQDSVTYRNLGLAVIDEQHRFGVSQRLMLTQKAERAAHLLVMTATPIPRTLTLATHGEMDVSRLDELPPGRTPVDTRVISAERLEEVIDGLGRHMAAGRQAFWVCPLVEDMGRGDKTAAEDRAALLRQRFGSIVGLVHGRMKGPEKDAVMEAFQRGDLKVLVATTVIEVGVNVPNASLMVIENADLFGLAQLHQLRGRVGRGAEKSVCLLIRPPQMGEVARARLALMRETNDGFRIAEEDLRLRGAGEILGTRQSGEAGFTIATDEQVSAMIGIAHDDARLFMDRDGGLTGERGEAVRNLLYLFERDAALETLRSG